MSDEKFEYSEAAIKFLGERMPNEMINVFIKIWQEKDNGVRHKELVKVIGDRYTVERSLLVLDTVGFIVPEKTMNMRTKKYLPHPLRGEQIANFISEQQQKKNNEQSIEL